MERGARGSARKDSSEGLMEDSREREGRRTGSAPGSKASGPEAAGAPGRLEAPGSASGDDGSRGAGSRGVGSRGAGVRAGFKGVVSRGGGGHQTILARRPATSPKSSVNKRHRLNMKERRTKGATNWLPKISTDD